MRSRVVVIGFLALSLACDLIAQTASVLAQTPSAPSAPSVSASKPLSGYMRDVGLIYIETVEGARNVDQLQTLRPLEDRIDIHVTEADKDFYERGLKKLRGLAEIRFGDLASAELPFRKVISDANRELDNILERNRAKERDYSQGLVSTNAYKTYLANSLTLLQQKKAETETAGRDLIAQESKFSALSPMYVACDNFLRQVIKAGEYNVGALENDCKLPGEATRQITPPQTTLTPQQQTLRQTVINDSNAQFTKDGVPGYVEIKGNVITVHSPNMTTTAARTFFSSPQFQQFVPTMKQAGLETLIFTNNADLNLVYYVNLGQLVGLPPEIGPPGTKK